MHLQQVCIWHVDDPLKLYSGEDCVKKFCNHIRQEAHRLYHMFPEKPMDPLTNRQWKSYKRVSKCHICYKPFNFKDPNASVNSKHQHPPQADPQGNFLKWSKTLPRCKIFLQKHGPQDKKILTPGEYCERSSQLFLLVSVEILEFCRNQTLKRTGRLFKSYPLVSV